MSDWHELLQESGFPHVRRHGVTLVARGDAPACIELIYSSAWRFLGYDAFTVAADSIQPHLEWSDDWSRTNAPGKKELLELLETHPPEVTHYEFVFSRAA